MPCPFSHLIGQATIRQATKIILYDFFHFTTVNTHAVLELGSEMMRTKNTHTKKKQRYNENVCRHPFGQHSKIRLMVSTRPVRGECFKGSTNRRSATLVTPASSSLLTLSTLFRTDLTSELWGPSLEVELALHRAIVLSDGFIQPAVVGTAGGKTDRKSTSGTWAAHGRQ